MLINKDLVKYRFSKSLNSYDNAAVVQKEMATLLIEKILTNCGKNFNKVFEFGVGTGFLSKNILDKITFEEYYANGHQRPSEGPRSLLSCRTRTNLRRRASLRTV